ncbi:MAG TPA: CxxxxCH/CxxCH domain-containing protein [Kofleriaceae bacterium]|nr:CxxxxCH/CxxCH domain-containing protein [Kofleriaceae bacterium]
MAAILTLSCSEEREREDGCIDCDGVHPAGILDPDSDDFHGRELERHDWDFALCAGCHGSAFDGGAAGVSCLDCHEDGVTACSTCHEAEPDSAAHPAHLARYQCAECHQVPERWDDDGHILRGGQADPAPAEVRFGEAAGWRPAFADEGEPPSYDPDTATCSGVYCHGDPLGDAAAADTRPVWTGGDPVECGSCHGAPPASHAPVEQCTTCHPASAGHIDGALAIGTGAGCSGCHGSSESPAPPRDLAGNTSNDVIGVGAHTSHRENPLELSGPVPCSACHQVPAETTSPGHVDTPLPAEVVLAGGGDWRRSDATCRTWCHGSSEPVWTRVGEGQVYCGSCHGTPPPGGLHEPEMQLTDCVDCHPATVDASGLILRSGPPGAETSEHMDGTVDF